MNSLLSEICLCFPVSTINRTIHFTEDIQGDSRDSIAFTNINMSPAPNDYDGDHNHQALQALTEDVPVEVLLKNIVPMQKSFSLEKSPPTNTLWLFSWKD